ncbi:DMT family transporter [Loktanella sp. SALINAS62]|uniref:DMT family transporter n=1 Tax=Loktanella sp. SALINAS62 TaxID=2706124 RepID=UPI001B8CD26A|nr:DMT family transporter [Loktanella sp. SALINAS62]MBS1303637.1 DMT family transporter [Loktanella sp. SALINAS62]
MTPTLRACLWMIGAIMSFTAMAVAGRQISFALDTFEIMLYRSLLGIVIVVTVGGLAGTLNQIERRDLRLHGVRNLAHFTGQNLWFFAVASIPLAQVFALEFTTPIWVLLLSPLFLSERITRNGAIAALVGFVGVLIVTRPGSIPVTPGLLAAAGCAIFFALSAIFTRRLTQSHTITCILFYLTTMQAVFGLVCAGWDMDIALPSATTLPWLVVIGCAGLLAHFCLTTALSLAPATIVMPIDFARLPTVAIIGAVAYSEQLDPWLFLGAAFIVAGNYVNLRKPKRVLTT